MPFGTGTKLPGYDGIVKSDKATTFIPEGISVWEMGTDKEPRGKANGEFDKRTSNSLDINKSETTFIFITPRLFQKKDEWIKEKKEINTWKDIKVYDSNDLAAWICDVKPVEIWFGRFIGKIPETGIVEPEQFWNEFSKFKDKEINHDVLIAGREIISSEICKNINSGEPKIIAIKASSKKESIAFIIASAYSSNSIKELFSAKCLIIRDEDVYRTISQQASKNKLILIPDFENHTAKYGAVSNKHIVIAPLDSDDEKWPQDDLITLPMIALDKVKIALNESGFSEQIVEECLKKSGPNIPIILKNLGFPAFNMVWLQDHNLAELIPALLVGKWNEKYEGDKNALKYLSNETYEEFKDKLTKFQAIPDSPIIQIGELWRISMVHELWIHLSQYLNKNNLEIFKNLICVVFNPNENEAPNNEILSNSKYSKTSNELKNGLLQTLVILDIYEENFNFKRISQFNFKSWISGIISKIMSFSWVSICVYFPQIAEASPETFLTSLEDDIKKNEARKLKELFYEQPSTLFPKTIYPSLLWALEGLAWYPEYLLRAGLILSELVEIDPGGTLTNRPINSLYEIFKYWHIQTSANNDDLIKVLLIISKKYPRVAFLLLHNISQETHSSVAFPTYKFSWRNLTLTEIKRKTYQEVQQYREEVLKILLEIELESYQELLLLSELSWTYDDSKRKAVLSKMVASLKILNEDDKVDFWEKLREKHAFYTSHKTNDWGISNENLNEIKQLIDDIEPQDLWNSFLWLFKGFNPTIIMLKSENDEVENYEKSADVLTIERKNALSILIDTYGVGEVIEKLKHEKAAFYAGAIIAELLSDEDPLIIEIIKGIVDKNNTLAQGFISIKARNNTIQWFTNIYKYLVSEGFSPNDLWILFKFHKPNIILWNSLKELNTVLFKTYWENSNSYLRHLDSKDIEMGIRYLAEYKNYRNAFEECVFNKEVISIDFIVNLLIEYIEKQEDSVTNPDNYHIEILIKDLQENISNAYHQKMLKIEWFFLSLLNKGLYQSNAKFLQKELCENPEFFIKILSLAYKNKDDEIDPESDPNIAENSWRVLKYWNLIPGSNEDGIINKAKLNEWVKKARKLALQAKRLEIAEVTIGEALGRLPIIQENLENYPPREICEIFEEIDSSELLDGYSTGIFNQRGITSRGYFEGGNLEREEAKTFDLIYNKLKIEFPKLSMVFKDLKDYYNRSAIALDKEAENRKLDSLL